MPTSSAPPRTERHGSSGHSGFISRASYTLETEAIVNAAFDYNHYEIEGRILRNLPEYDNYKDYTEAYIEHATRAEVTKLVAIASDDTPPLFNSQNSFGGISLRDFKYLSEIADQLICNLSILLHDNSRLALQLTHIKPWVMDIMVETRRKLHLDYQLSGSFETVEGRASQVLLDGAENYKAYLRLLDYVLGTMSWWLMHCAQSDFWDKHLIAILAKWAVKLKIIAIDPQKSAIKSLNGTKDTIEILEKKPEITQAFFQIGGEDRDVNIHETKEDLSEPYHEEKMYLRDRLSGLFVGILEALRTQVPSKYEPDYFEVCSLIYWAKEQGLANMIMGFRDGNISTSSVLSHITYLHSAFQFLELNTDRMRDRHISSAPHTGHMPYVKIRRSKWTGGRHVASKPEEISIYSMDDVISLLVPLSLLNARVAHRAGSLVDFSNKAESGDIIQRAGLPDEYFSEYILSTRSWMEENCPTSLATTVVSDARHLSQSPTRIGLQCDGTGTAISDGQQSISELRKDYNKHVEYMNKWNCRIRRVDVHCKMHARVFRTILVMIVMGGFFFEMTMFTWLLCGLILVVAKSLTFPEWPWSGFLTGSVACSRLSDLANISGIGPQIVLLFLLERKASTAFVTQGPYNSVFHQRWEEKTDGFIIDEPIDLWTLMAAGMIVLKVVSTHDEYLVCLDGRRDNWNDALQGAQDDWLAYRYFNQVAVGKIYGASRSGATNEREVFTLEQTSIKVSKVLGVYVREARFG